MSRGFQTLVQPGDRHKHCAPEAGGPGEGEKPVGQGTGRQHQATSQSGILFKRLCEPGGGSSTCVPGSIQRRALAQVEEQDTASYLKLMGEKLEALLREIKDNRDQQKTVGQETRIGALHGELLMPSKRALRGHMFGTWTVVFLTVEAGPNAATTTKEVQPLGCTRWTGQRLRS